MDFRFTFQSYLTCNFAMKDSEIGANYHNMWWFGRSMFNIRQLKGFIAIRSMLMLLIMSLVAL